MWLLNNKKHFSLKNTFKVALQYLFNEFILFKLNFKLDIDPKMRTLENLEKFLKKRVATLICHTNNFLFVFLTI